MTIFLDKEGMSLEQVVAVARRRVPVDFSEAARHRLRKARALVDSWVAEGRVIYGVTTGFGALSDVVIPAADVRALQRNILMSHAAGVGPELAPDEVRALMVLRLKDFARGHSGIRWETAVRLRDFLNADLLPIIPAKGSVGASGDLAPMAHMALPLIGMGEVLYGGERISGAEALRRLGLKPLELEAGEGLALVNGTQLMTALGALAVHDAETLSKTADIAASMSLEVLMGSRMEFDPRIHRVRPHPGQAKAAHNMRRITHGSDIISSHKDCSRVQDAYTLRCSPQVHGASKDVIAYCRRVIEREINAATNNPLIFADSGEFLLGGNFHGQPLALAMDFLAIALAELADISERRIERLVNPQLSGLPAFLVSQGGLHSGFMIAQYTAAALVSENKTLAHPASVDSIPTSANKEDHVSMGTFAARKCHDVVRNVETVLAIELLCGAQALDLFTNMRPGVGTLAAYRRIRSEIPHLERDRVLAPDIEAMVQLLRSQELVVAVEAEVGKLHP